MSIIKFRVAAKTDVGLIRTNNEDNFQVSWDLSSLPMRWVNNETHQLGDKGCLLVVADGMGGANAGEVASQIAIDTIKSVFTPEKISNDILSSKDSINCFIKDAIILADENIKKYAVSHPETKGMGTTIVVAWVYKDKLYIGWCGDSRAYIYNSVYGLIRLTKDHSYVQQLVDSGKLSEDEAFDFPDSNIITQCLSASPQKCKPETLAKPFNLSNGDIILLCTDGVCGMIRDVEIESILSNADEDLNKTSDSLIDAALRASGADNATLCLMKIINGLKPATPTVQKKKDKSRPFILIGSAIILILLGLIAWFMLGKQSNNTPLESDIIATDSLTNVPSDSIESESIQQEANDTTKPQNSNSERQIESNEDKGNGDNLLKGFKPGNVPSTEKGATESEGQDVDVEVVATPDIIVVKIPSGKSLYAFLKEFGMNQSDFKKLNPDKDPNTLKSGDDITVYKKK